jgi:CDP-glucose 4,6-dehydratase
MNAFDVLAGKKIFLTGHTGFTGSWASIWLSQLSAEVFGYALEPDTQPSLFYDAQVAKLVESKIADIRDYETLLECMQNFEPDLVLHLAAQPLVSRSYKNPRETFDINCQGTANILEATLNTSSVQGILCVTTDKVYKNSETGTPFIETDELGGKDPYSSSKAAAEVTISSFRQLARAKGSSTPIVTVARGGNIIGGGDWSDDRIVPDFMRAYKANQSLGIRHPESTRPWQHVISLLDGYFSILAGMLGPKKFDFDQAFNLGPSENTSITVGKLVGIMGETIPNVTLDKQDSFFAEAGLLSLDSSLAQKTFDWSPIWNTETAIKKTASWYKAYLSESTSALQLCVEQLSEWSDSRSTGLRIRNQ